MQLSQTYPLRYIFAPQDFSVKALLKAKIITIVDSVVNAKTYNKSKTFLFFFSLHGAKNCHSLPYIKFF